MKLDRPIIVTGPPRSGTTLLAGILNWHSSVGPKPPAMSKYKRADEFIDAVRQGRAGYTKHVERNDVWFKLIPGFGVFQQLGEPMWRADEHRTDTHRLADLLSRGLVERRLISKSPSHIFRLTVIRKTFPDCRIVVILREGEQVAASLLVHGSAGFSKRYVNMRLDCPEGWRLFADRWNHAIETVIASRGSDVLYVSYETLVREPMPTLQRVFDHCQLEVEPYVEVIRPVDRTAAWRERIAADQHDLLSRLLERGNQMMRKVTACAP